MIKDNCVSCNVLIHNNETKLKRYMVRGNYCSTCCTKADRIGILRRIVTNEKTSNNEKRIAENELQILISSCKQYLSGEDFIRLFS